MDLHGTQHVQPRPELPVVIGKCLFQDTVDGELSRIEEALLRDPRNVSQLFLNSTDESPSMKCFLSNKSLVIFAKAG